MQIKLLCSFLSENELRTGVFEAQGLFRHSAGTLLQLFRHSSGTLLLLELLLEVGQLF